jgi:hypothetical protein
MQSHVSRVRIDCFVAHIASVGSNIVISSVAVVIDIGGFVVVGQ